MLITGLDSQLVSSLTVRGAGNAGINPNYVPVTQDLLFWTDNSRRSTITKDGSDKVSQGGELSGQANNLVQGTGAAQPTFTDKHINDKSVLTYDGTADHMDTTSSIALTGEFSMFFVLNNQDIASTRMFCGNNADDNKLGTTNLGKEFIRIIDGGSSFQTASVPAEDATYLLTLQRNSADKIDRAYNGAVFTRIFADAAQSGTSSWDVFGTSNSALFWQGDMAEIIIYSRALSSSEIAMVHNYLSPKWGVTLA